MAVAKVDCTKEEEQAQLAGKVIVPLRGDTAWVAMEIREMLLGATGSVACRYDPRPYLSGHAGRGASLVSSAPETRRATREIRYRIDGAVHQQTSAVVPHVDVPW